MVKSDDGWKGVDEWVDIENNLQVCTALTDEETAWFVTDSHPREENNYKPEWIWVNKWELYKDIYIYKYLQY